MLRLILLSGLFITSFYTVQYTTIDGGNGNFSGSQGKRVLVVNIASASQNVNQLGELQQLYQQYHDSLDIYAFPSNSFGHEPMTNTEIKQLCLQQYSVTYKLGAKGDVKGPGRIPVYDWLCNQSQNGVMNAAMFNDYQKFLLDKNGNLVGVFGPEVSPLDTVLVNAILENR